VNFELLCVCAVLSLSLADFASDRRDRSLWIKAAVNIAEQRLVLPLLADFFFGRDRYCRGFGEAPY
jgi:hypothetical protein